MCGEPSVSGPTVQRENPDVGMNWIIADNHQKSADTLDVRYEGHIGIKKNSDSIFQFNTPKKSVPYQSQKSKVMAASTGSEVTQALNRFITVLVASWRKAPGRSEITYGNPN